MIDHRYSRVNLVDWISQDAFSKMHIGVVGCGATGNEVIKNLALLGVGKIDVYDFDKIEIHNLPKSVLFRETDIGKEKSVVVAERAQDLDPNIEVVPFTGDFWELMTFRRAQQYNVIVCCVDNFEARIRINQLCTLLRKPWINTAIDDHRATVEVYPLVNHLSACYECNLPLSVYQEISKRYSCGALKKITFVEKKIPTTPISASLAGAMAASFAVRIGNYEKEQSFSISIDSKTGDYWKYSLLKNDCCPICDSEHDVEIFHASPKIKTILSHMPKEGMEKVYIHTSDKILVEYRCVRCNPSDQNGTLVFDRASKFDNMLEYCKNCGGQSIDVKILDTFTLKELSTKYNGLELPCKFIFFEINGKQIIINLED